MTAMNFLYIISDEHARNVTGCYGNPIVRTPNIDRLAALGTRFSAAYTPAPICAPARACAATGMPTSATGCWDQAHPYRGDPPSWGHYLRGMGHEVISVGKQHFRSTEDDYGFTSEVLPMHLHRGFGDLMGCQRNPPAERTGMHRLALDVGPGESPYTRQDRKVAAYTADWLRTKGRESSRPWALTAGFILPHFPLFAPQRFYDLYPPHEMPLPRLYGSGDVPSHPVLRTLKEVWNYDDFFEDEDAVRRCIAGYYACTTFVDEQIGVIMGALDEAGLSETTRIIYTSDHGDTLGNRRMWGKFTMYEESVAIPMVMAGPGIPAGAVCDDPVSLVDIFPTAVQCVGGALADEDRRRLSGVSLIATANGAGPGDRAILSEYHAAGSPTGIFCLITRRWKYVHFEGYSPQLFDREADPGELCDLGTDPGHAEIVAALHRRLTEMVDPVASNRQAFADQQATMGRHGGFEACQALSAEVQKLGFTPPPDDVPSESAIGG